MPCGGDGGRLGRWAGQGRSAQRISRAASLLGAVLGLPAEVERDVFKQIDVGEAVSFLRGSGRQRERDRTLVLDHVGDLAPHGQAEETGGRRRSSVVSRWQGACKCTPGHRRNVRDEVDEKDRPVDGDVARPREREEERKEGRARRLEPELEL
jgi:hypothetical protein